MKDASNASSIVEKLPDEVLTMIFRPLLLLSEDLNFQRRFVNHKLVFFDAALMSRNAYQGVTAKDLKRTHWFNKAANCKRGIWARMNAERSSRDACRQWPRKRPTQYRKGAVLHEGLLREGGQHWQQ